MKPSQIKVDPPQRALGCFLISIVASRFGVLSRVLQSGCQLIERRRNQFKEARAASALRRLCRKNRAAQGI